MSRYAPTLFVGLGGSGIHILRNIKTYVERDVGDGSLRDVPVAFLAFDFDPRSNEEAAESMKPLLPGEFRFFDPRTIATCVRNVNRTRAGETPDGKPRWEFPEILDWYPDPEARYIGYPQGEENGARQWRPLGRLGFFMNDRDMLAAISGALSELDKRRGATERLGSNATVCLVASLGGGTGSSMIFDVAVNLRKIRRDISVRTYLLLPEVFEGIEQKDRLLPNSFATIWEIANLKNHHVRFTARYPRIPAVTEDDSPPPFQRVFLLGPFVGERRPFPQPSDVYPTLAEILYLAMTPELRAAAISSEANASADSAAALTDPRSRHVFCTTAAMGINLINYAELGDLCAARLATELISTNRYFSRSLAGPKPPDPVSEQRELIEARAEDVTLIANDYFRDQLTNSFTAEPIPPGEWTRDTLQQEVMRIRALCGMTADRFPDVLLPVLERTRSDVQARLDEIRARYVVPGECRTVLRELRDALPQDEERLPTPPPPAILENFEQWLGGRWLWFLARPLLMWRLHRLVGELVTWIDQIVGDEGKRTWLKVAVLRGARQAVEAALRDEDQRLASLPDFIAAVKTRLTGYDVEERQREQVYLDGRRADALAVLQRELAKVPNREVRDKFRRDVLDRFVRAHEAFAKANDEKNREEIIDRWLSTNRLSFRRTLGRRERDAEPPEDPDDLLVSPGSLFTQTELRDALLRARTRVFEDGRTSAPSRTRVARAIVPARFERFKEYEETLRGLCRGFLNANVQIESTATNRHKRIVVLVDELFHPAEDIAGIYDYYNEYRRAEVDRTLFHLHKDWPSKFFPIVSSAARRTVVQCGNPGCPRDIRAQDPTRVFCGHCMRPIRSRCGNRDCPVEDLHNTPNLDDVILSKHCPECRRFLRTYWWKCAEHGDVPIDKRACPDCVRLGRPRPSRRPDVENRFVCPKCESMGIEQPFIADEELAEFLRNGVNGHDLLRADRLFDRHLNRNRTCRKCGTVLVPTCSESNSQDLHYLHRDLRRGPDEPFRCYHHGITYLRCGVCDYPVERDSRSCNRCGNGLRKCRFCTPAAGVLTREEEGDVRCARCGLYPDRPTRVQEATRPAEKPDDLFCSDIYGCAAGARLTEATFVAGTKVCGVCKSAELHLLDVQTRVQHLAACRFCMEIFGGVVRFDPTLRHGRSCCLCGQAWAVTDDLSGDSDGWHIATAIGSGLIASVNDDAVFAQVYASVGAKVSLLPHFQAFVERIERRSVRDVVAPRVLRLIEHWNSQFRCQSAPSESKHSGRPRETISRTLDPDEILRFEGDIAGWVRWLRRGGITLPTLRAMKEQVEQRVANDHVKRQRIRSMFHDAEAQWDSIKDDDDE